MNYLTRNKELKITSQELRKLWFQYWEQHLKHKKLPSVSLVSPDSSLWINSGVAGLKRFFLTAKKLPYTRIVNIQKAVRTNDLDLIGKTNRHLSFFEMMGNFSLGDYGKRETILWSWEFLTAKEWLHLDKNKIYITVFQEDQESIAICKKDLQITSGNLFLKGIKTNFWDLGVGPCGPSLEFFYDLGPKLENQKELENTALLIQDIENDRYLEIWNIVFSELFNVTSGSFPPHLSDTKIIYPSLRNGNYRNLPRKNIDTGMGLERVLTVLQDKTNCFETDLFSNLFESFCTVFKTNISHLSKEQVVANSKIRIIVDHIRTIVFTLTDLMASTQTWDFQNKHGYTIRKLIRNASLQGYFLKIRKPFLWQIAKQVINEMKDVYLNLSSSNELERLITREEEKFLSLLIQNEKTFVFPPNHVLTGKEMFKLVTESGLSLHFLQTISQEKKVILNAKGYADYQLLIKEHKIKSKKQEKNWSWVTVHSTHTLPALGPTVFEENCFSDLKVKVLAIFPPISNNQLTKKISFDKKILNKLGHSEEGWVIVDKTPFYASKGGQVTDQGIFFGSESKGTVSNVIVNDCFQHLHYVVVDKGEITVGDQINFRIQAKRRKLISNNHSSTHLLHAVLRKNLDDETVRQCGSLNNDHYLRLDFFSKLTREVIKKHLFAIETEVNQLIKQNIQPAVFWTTHKEAEKMQALDFFDVKQYYSTKVRVVKFANYSIELCGGTHVLNTAQIERFIITGFKKIGQYAYRIYALTTEDTINHFLETEDKNFQKIVNFIQQKGKKNIQQILNKINSSKDFYLHKKELQSELIRTYKIHQEDYEGGNLNRLVKVYSVPESSSLGKISFIYHQVDFDQQIEEKKFQNLITDKQNPWFYSTSQSQLLFSHDFPKHTFLWKLFDKLKNKENDFVFLFIKQGDDKWIFVMHFDNKYLNQNWWNNCLKTNFYDQIQFGIKPNKIQGVLKIPPQEFFYLLKVKIEELLKKHS